MYIGFNETSEVWKGDESMIAPQILNEVLTLAEAVKIVDRLGHPIDRGNLIRYAQTGRLPARKSGGTWLTTRTSLRDLVVSLEAETRGRPRPVQLSGQRTIRYTRTPELLSALKDIQRLRGALRDQPLSAEQEARLWEKLTTAAVYHTTHLEGNLLTFEEAQSVIDEHRQRKKTAATHDAPTP